MPLSIRLARAASSAPILAGRWLKPNFSSGTKRQITRLGGLGVAAYTAQHYLGAKDDFFEHRFVTTKKPEDLADFYGTEAFMEVFCVLPFMVKLMMRSGTFDDEGKFNTWGLTGPGELEVSIDFDEREEDTTGDGEPDTIAWFNKREHFKDVTPFGGFTLWEMTQNFGYNRLDDGTCEVYHHGEHFEGFFPIRFLFQVHSQYVIWATKRYINSDEFGTEDLEDDAEVIRQNVPMYAFKEFLQGLTREVEKARDEQEPQSMSAREHDKTIKQLQRLSTKDYGTSLPHFRTIRRRSTALTKLQLVVEDEETQKTIKVAMAQVGEAKGAKDEAIVALDQLQKKVEKSTSSSNEEEEN